MTNDDVSSNDGPFVVDVDIFFTCLNCPSPPKLPLRQELCTLGFEMIRVVRRTLQKPDMQKAISYDAYLLQFGNDEKKDTDVSSLCPTEDDDSDCQVDEDDDSEDDDDFEDDWIISKSDTTISTKMVESEQFLRPWNHSEDDWADSDDDCAKSCASDEHASVETIDCKYFTTLAADASEEELGKHARRMFGFHSIRLVPWVRDWMNRSHFIGVKSRDAEPCALVSRCATPSYLVQCYMIACLVYVAVLGWMHSTQQAESA